MMAVLAILKASRAAQVVLLILAAWGLWEGNNALQRSAGRAEGRSEVTTAVREKADANAEVATQAREAVAARKPGKPDPHRLRPRAEGRPAGSGN